MILNNLDVKYLRLLVEKLDQSIFLCKKYSDEDSIYLNFLIMNKNRITSFIEDLRPDLQRKIL